MRVIRWLGLYLLGCLLCVLLLGQVTKVIAGAPPAVNPQNGALGVEGQINGAPPTQAASITVPTNGQSFSSLPIRVAGLCPKGLLVEIFKNNVFAGSTQCTSGSYSLQIDLFDGHNDLVARVYDALNQAGPDSNTVGVNFNASLPSGSSLVLITTTYATRGADPNSNLTWPLTLSGGIGPYAISVDWGDNTTSDLISRQFDGDFTIQHVYKQSGIFNVSIKATDSKGTAAFLQLVAVSNGPTQQSSSKSGTAPAATTTKRVVLWWPLVLLFVLTFIAFWLGRKHQLESIRSRLRRGQRPF